MRFVYVSGREASRGNHAKAAITLSLTINKTRMKTETTFGGSGENNRAGFAIVCESAIEGKDGITTAILNHGIASLLYRGGASVLLNSVFPGMKSTEVEYSDEGASKVKNALEAWFAGGCTTKRGKATLPEGLPVEVSVSRYEFGIAPEKAFSIAKGVCSAMESTPAWESWVQDSVGFKGETHDEKGEYTTELLVAVDKLLVAKRAEKAKKTAEGLANLGLKK